MHGDPRTRQHGRACHSITLSPGLRGFFIGRRDLRSGLGLAGTGAVSRGLRTLFVRHPTNYAGPFERVSRPASERLYLGSITRRRGESRDLIAPASTATKPRRLGAGLRADARSCTPQLRFCPRRAGPDSELQALIDLRRLSLGRTKGRSQSGTAQIASHSRHGRRIGSMRRLWGSTFGRALVLRRVLLISGPISVPEGC
jgi:hypothetical protein